MSGKLIVIDGGDGAGKATQVSLLVARLRLDGCAVETLDFPQYTQHTFGALIRECLDGKRGDFMSVDARIASVLFAADRFEAKPRLEQWRSEGKLVVLDRYVSANMMHQGAKIDEPAALELFLSWLDHVEHGIFGLPRPDIIIYLDVPHLAREQMKHDAVASKKHGAEVGLDVAEQSRAHQEAVERRARDIVAARNNWHRINCVADDGTIRSRASIHDEVYNVVVGAFEKENA